MYPPSVNVDLPTVLPVGRVSMIIFLTWFLTIFLYYMNHFQQIGTQRGHYWKMMISSASELCDAQWSLRNL